MSIYNSTKVVPYVYRLENPITGEFYIGYRSANISPSSEDFGITYKTSAPKIEETFNQFNWQIIAEFFDGDSAYDFEQLLIFENWNNPLLLNKSCFHNKKRFKAKKGINNRIGFRVSDETKLKLSMINIGHIVSSETRNKISIANKGKIISDDTKYKMSVSAKIVRQNSTTNRNVKIWTICTETDGNIHEITALKPWCKLLNISYKSMLRTLISKKYHQGFKIIEKK
jgi:hypothetical protein